MRRDCLIGAGLIARAHAAVVRAVQMLVAILAAGLWLGSHPPIGELWSLGRRLQRWA